MSLQSEQTSLLEEKLSKQTITAVQLTIMIYFWTTGGPFGIESAVGAGGALLTLLTQILVLLFWCLPQALLSAELSLMTKVNGGNVIWVQMTFGNFVGFVNAGCNFVFCIVSQALTVDLVIKYIPEQVTDLSVGAQWGIRIAFRYSASKQTPMVATILYRRPVYWEALILIPNEDIKWGILISTVVWAFGAFDYVGSVAGEVKGGRSTYLKGLAGAFVLDIINYTIPIIIGFVIQPSYKSWGTAYFTLLTFELFPKWLGIMMIISSLIACFGQLSAGFSSSSRVFWAMAKGKEDNIAMHRYLPLRLSWSLDKEGTIPIGAILMNSILTLALSAINFEILVQVYLIVRLCNILLEFAALIFLKFKCPNAERPFEVPGGKIGSIILVIPIIALSGFAIATSDWITIAVGFGVLGVIIICFPLKLLWVYINHGRKLPENFVILPDIANITVK